MTTLYRRSWPQMNETPDSLLATDEPPPFTVDNDNGIARSSSSPITRGSIFRGGLNSPAFPMPNARVTLPGTSASARFAA
jgi:hypothetical protein